MDLPRNNFKHALAAGKAQIGLWSSLSNSYCVEVIAGTGFDWILIDTEHSPADLENVLRQLQAAASYPTEAVGFSPPFEQSACRALAPPHCPRQGRPGRGG